MERIDRSDEMYVMATTKFVEKIYNYHSYYSILSKMDFLTYPNQPHEIKITDPTYQFTYDMHRYFNDKTRGNPQASMFALYFILTNLTEDMIYDPPGIREDFSVMFHDDRNKTPLKPSYILKEFQSYTQNTRIDASRGWIHVDRRTEEIILNFFRQFIIRNVDGSLRQVKSRGVQEGTMKRSYYNWNSPTNVVNFMEDVANMFGIGFLILDEQNRNVLNPYSHTIFLLRIRAKDSFDFIHREMTILESAKLVAQKTIEEIQNMLTSDYLELQLMYVSRNPYTIPKPDAGLDEEDIGSTPPSSTSSSSSRPSSPPTSTSSSSSTSPSSSPKKSTTASTPSASPKKSTSPTSSLNSKLLELTIWAKSAKSEEAVPSNIHKIADSILQDPQFDFFSCFLGLLLENNYGLLYYLSKTDLIFPDMIHLAKFFHSDASVDLKNIPDDAKFHDLKEKLQVEIDETIVEKITSKTIENNNSLHFIDDDGTLNDILFPGTTFADWVNGRDDTIKRQLGIFAANLKTREILALEYPFASTYNDAIAHIMRATEKAFVERVQKEAFKGVWTQFKDGILAKPIRFNLAHIVAQIQKIRISIFDPYFNFTKILGVEDDAAQTYHLFRSTADMFMQYIPEGGGGTK